MARKTLTDKSVLALKPRDKLYAQPDPQLPGHYIRVSPTGSRTFVAVTRDPNGKQVWTTIGKAHLIGIEEARAKAREIINRVKGGQRVEGPESFQEVASEWLRRHVDAKAIITAPAIRGNLHNHVLPVWAGREFESIKRSDVAALMDRVEDNAGPVAADRVLTILSSIFSWYAAWNDDYNSPIVRGMRRSNTKERARDRILSDDEIRLIWSKAEGTFGDLVRMLLLTGQRRDKVASMKWDDVSVDGVWSVKNGVKREKGTGGELVLPTMALDIIRARPRFASNPYIFPGPSGASYFRTYDRAKRALDRAIGPLPQWQLHDLRRTARSLMSRAGVRDEHAERVLGHTIGGVEGIYNRHDHFEQKREALKMLAGLIDNILRGDADEKVRRLRG
ncbi:MAG TPA: site-specific integrase [Methyloceanibacter sp.]|nr:site-specific integrase [Methyloceanibacter sp.]